MNLESVGFLGQKLKQASGRENQERGFQIADCRLQSAN